MPPSTASSHVRPLEPGEAQLRAQPRQLRATAAHVPGRAPLAKAERTAPGRGPAAAAEANGSAGAGEPAANGVSLGGETRLHLSGSRTQTRTLVTRVRYSPCTNTLSK